MIFISIFIFIFMPRYGKVERVLICVLEVILVLFVKILHGLCLIMRLMNEGDFEYGCCLLIVDVLGVRFEWEYQLKMIMIRLAKEWIYWSLCFKLYFLLLLELFCSNFSLCPISSFSFRGHVDILHIFLYGSALHNDSSCTISYLDQAFSWIDLIFLLISFEYLLWHFSMFS